MKTVRHEIWGPGDGVLDSDGGWEWGEVCT
jgi:hypothetical protein